MKLYLISNNLLLEGLDYKNTANLDVLRLVRPLSITGEEIAKKISELKCLQEIEHIYSSFHSSAIATSKYLANNLELKINLTSRLNDCKVGDLGSKNMKMVKGLQDHEFTYKLTNGESLIDVGNRLDKIIQEIIVKKPMTALFTHKRAILGFLLKYAKVGYNLDENLILDYNGNIIYDDSDTDYDIYEITFENSSVIDIKRIY